MTTASSIDLADRVIATLRERELELRESGIRHLSVFGSVARGEARADSDIDLIADFDPAARIDLVRLVALEREIGNILGRPVELHSERLENPRLRARVDWDRRVAF